jgi:hypothetical protein
MLARNLLWARVLRLQPKLEKLRRSGDAKVIAWTLEGPLVCAREPPRQMVVERDAQGVQVTADGEGVLPLSVVQERFDLP